MNCYNLPPSQEEDHQAFAQVLGSYGEFIEALAVVATLIYLALQNRQNSNIVKAQIRQSFADNAASAVDCQHIGKSKTCER